jgi:hypothetical protein
MARKYNIPLDVDYLVREYLAGRSVLDLSREFGVSRNVIDRRLDSAGVIRRGQSEANITSAARVTPEARLARVDAAHSARRGSSNSFAQMVKAAIAKQATKSGMSGLEEMVVSDLRSCCIDPIPQLAIGPYNCDLACHPVAVEIFGGQWHFSGRHLDRTEKRIRYLGDAGWHVLMLVVDERRSPYSIETGNYLVSYIKSARADPSAPREYRVIDCRGQTIATGRCDDDQISIKPSFANGRDPASGRYKRIPL